MKRITKAREVDEKLPLVEHIIELRDRIILSLIVFIIFFGIAYIFVEDIFVFLVSPLLDNIGETRKLIYTNLSEAFFTYIKLAMFSSCMVTIPIILWQLYLFISPGLYNNEKRKILPILIFSPIMFYIGIIFAYYIVFPMAWGFFTSFEKSSAIPIILEARISEYLSISMHLMIAFGIAFQLPIILIILMKFGIITPEALRNKRKYAIVASFVIAAIITPPDVISQISLAIPMILLYEVAIIICSRKRI